MTFGSWIVDDVGAHRRKCEQCESLILAATTRPFWVPLELLCETGRSLYRGWWEWAFELRYPRSAEEAAAVPPFQEDYK